MDITKIQFFTNLEVRWSDLDSLGHVNNVIYIEYFQIGRGKYISSICPSWNWSKDMFVVANVNCNFLSEIPLEPIALRIGVAIEKIGTKSFQMQYAIISDAKDGSDILHATGTTTQVMIDIQKKESCAVPQWFIDNVKRFEKFSEL